jgi:hypothetical protein
MNYDIFFTQYSNIPLFHLSMWLLMADDHKKSYIFKML